MAALLLTLSTRSAGPPGGGIALAQSAPYTAYGVGLSPGDEVAAFIDGALCGSTTADAQGQWVLRIRNTDPCGPANGDTITFAVNGASAEETASWALGGTPATSGYDPDEGIPLTVGSTPTPTPTIEPTAEPTEEPTEEPTPTATAPPTASATPTEEPTVTATLSPTPRVTASITPSATATARPPPGATVVVRRVGADADSGGFGFGTIVLVLVAIAILAVIGVRVVLPRVRGPY